MNQRQGEIINKIFGWINRYGLPTVAVVFMYFNFIYPMKAEREEMSRSLNTLALVQLRMSEQIADVQKDIISNQRTMLDNQKDIFNSNKRIIRLLEEHNLKEHTDPADREEQRRKYLEENECLLESPMNDTLTLTN